MNRLAFVLGKSIDFILNSYRIYYISNMVEIPELKSLNFNLGSVTLMGHGTGASCVNLLMLSPVAQGTIQFKMIYFSIYQSLHLSFSME